MTGKERSRKFRREHREESLQYSKNYYHRNKTKMRAKHRERYKRVKDAWKKIVVELGYGTCSMCGYDKCFSAIDCHHKDPKKKEFGLANFYSKTPTDETIQRFKEEIKKTVPLCCRCHRELHEEMKCSGD
jgi:hypothetical protein